MFTEELLLEYRHSFMKINETCHLLEQQVQALKDQLDEMESGYFKTFDRVEKLQNSQAKDRYMPLYTTNP